MELMKKRTGSKMEIKPFKAYRYNGDVVGDANACISPPYDVIGQDQQERLYGQNDHNVVRIIRGKAGESDSENENVYSRAAGYLQKWIESGALKQDEQESIYAYIQNFDISGQDYERYSFISLMQLEEFGQSVRAHENTLSKPKADRLNLLRATQAKFGLVYMLYDDMDNIAETIIEEAKQNEAAIDFCDDDGVRHRLYPIQSPVKIEAICEMMSDKTCIIADGHHRYETALAYSKESDNPNAKYLMAAFSNTKQPGMIVLATHRLINNVDNFDSEAMLKRLKEHFDIERFDFDSAETMPVAREQMLAKLNSEFEKGTNAFGIYAHSGAFYVATLKDAAVMESAAPQASSAWRKLDVTVLHKLILEAVVGIDEDMLADGEHVEYIKDAGQAVDESILKVDAGQKQAAFFMNPPRIEQIEQVAENGEKMPQKSTFFYPKVYTGLTIYKL